MVDRRRVAGPQSPLQADEFAALDQVVQDVDAASYTTMGAAIRLSFPQRAPLMTMTVGAVREGQGRRGPAGRSRTTASSGITSVGASR